MGLSGCQRGCCDKWNNPGLLLTPLLRMMIPAHGDAYKNTSSLPVFCNAMRILNLSADDYVYPNGNAHNTTYQQLLRLLTHCDEHQLQVLLATAEALLRPASEPDTYSTE